MMGRRGKQPEGPRASFKQLLPFIFEHKRVLAVVIVLAVSWDGMRARFGRRADSP